MTSTTPKLAAFGLTAITLLTPGASPSAAQPLGRDLQFPRPVRLSFQGTIDGSEVIEITATHAHWTHRHWGWPGDDVVLNDVVWNPRKQSSLDNSGKTQFLHQAVNFSSARLENVTGRDIVSLEAAQDLARIHICDSPNGADAYAFDIVFDPLPVEQSLRIRASIDGSDRLVIDKTGIWWEHRHWKWPEEIRIDDLRWDPRKTPRLAYGNAFDGAVDFSSARLSSILARDMVVLQRGPGRVVVDFADSPLGRAVYDVTIHFGD